MVKRKIFLTLSFQLISLITFSQQEFRLNLSCSPSFTFHGESFIKNKSEIYNSKSSLYYGIGLGYKLTENLNFGAEYGWFRRVVSIETPGKDFDIKLRHVSIPIYLDWKIAHSILNKNFAVIIGIGGSMNYLGDNETKFNSQSNTETYEGFFRFYESKKIAPGMLFKIATEKKTSKYGIFSVGVSYQYIFPSEVMTECRVNYKTTSISGEIKTSDHSNYSMGFIQLSIKYIYPINLKI